MGKWILILLVIYGAFRLVIWLVSDRSSGLSEFWEDFFNPFYNSVELALWAGIPILLILAVAVYAELPLSMQRMLASLF